MSSRLQRKLSEAYPLIMGDPSHRARILCGDGWFDLLERGLAELQAFCDLCSDGRQRLQVRIEQAQERDGALCFYHSVEGGDDFEREIIQGIVGNMEISSLYFCEFTGVSPACLCRRGPRLRTLSYEAARQDGYELCSPDYANGWRELNASSHPSPAGSSAPPAPAATGRSRHARPRRRRFRPASGGAPVRESDQRPPASVLT